MIAGPMNHILDVPGLTVGHADDADLRSGVSVVLFDTPAVAAVDVRGGGPGARETELLAPDMTVETVDAITLSGGSAFGLDAPGGAMDALRAMGRGFAVGPARVPIVPGAILFDQGNGGNKDWGPRNPYGEMGWRAARGAGRDGRVGSVGAGLGAQAGRLRGGLGAASTLCPETGATVGALAAVNALGSAVVGEGPWFWAAPFEIGEEFGGLGLPPRFDAAALAPVVARSPRESTTIAVVATDAILTPGQARRLAVMAQDGLARALHPAHGPLDGDIVFAAATGRRALADPLAGLARLGALAGMTLARAVARGVHAADTSADLPGMAPAWRDLHA
jgi:L-aminopeptidase/D-esterase-like protein